MDTIEGKVAVVTGAASGIGLAMSRRFASAGAKVVMADIEDDALDTALDDVRSMGAEAIRVRTDVRELAHVEALRDAALDAFGAVHVVCNNAGVGGGGTVWDSDLADWRWVIDVNLWGVIYGCHVFLPLLRDQGEGHVVNTASMAGLTASPFMGPYNVSKFGVVALSETIHGELSLEGSNVGVSVLCPGWVNTRIGDADRNRPGGPRPEDATEDRAAARDVLRSLLATGLDPADVAEQVLAAVLERRFYILTHPEWNPMIAVRAERIIAGDAPAHGFLPEA
ncbi:MAG: SDR family NAD(P)-dependent oxidoreductase [Actinobacteria bacterium]|nr:SDR family NAD(P)-dependent oxidoreductase [Actinomycetota bacterium]